MIKRLFRALFVWAKRPPIRYSWLSCPNGHGKWRIAMIDAGTEKGLGRTYGFIAVCIYEGCGHSQMFEYPLFHARRTFPELSEEWRKS